MDHKVSKDMISSGMTPSGEKTQADLGRTQYGSAPSPSKLMDAYKSMYGNKEEVINEMDGKGMGMTPAPKPTDSPKTEKPKTETDKMLDKVSDRRVEKAVNRDKDVRRARASYIMTKYGESVDLLAAYRSVYEHHKKDADGNTIPHEDEEVNEGKIPAGLQAYLDKKKGKKEDKKEVKEEIDMFDNILEHYLNEGYQREDILKAMSSLSEEPITLATIGSLLAKGGAMAAKGAAVAGKVAAKGGAMAAKGLASAGKTVAANVGNAAKGVASVPGKISSGVKKVGGAVKNFYGNEKISPFIKQQVTQSAIDMGTKTVGAMKPRGLQKKTSGTISASADLFDIVKGQLLDEGLSEEEIKDIMLTLTPDEIMKEMNQGPSTPVKNYGDSPNKPKILPNFGATRAKPRTTDKGTIIKGGKDTGKTPAQMSQEEYKNFDPKKPDPKQMAAQAKQEKIRQKNNDPMGVKNTNIGGQGLDPMDK